jgi:pimeloyl-ACP methyl ester carboxylesterase
MTQPQLDLMPVAPQDFHWRGHRIAVYQDGSGPDLLLIHSINAAASAFEMREPFQLLRNHYRVHALDLLGYGNSDRPPLTFTADLYVDLIGDYLQSIGRPTIVIASSLAAAYSIVAADRLPQAVSHLILVCPVGIRQLARPAGPLARRIHRFLRGRPGELLLRALTTRRNTRVFLAQQAYADARTMNAVRADTFSTCSHQPQAHYAPISFVTGLLNCDAGPAFSRLPMPVQLIWGREAKTTALSRADEFLALRPQTPLVVIDRAAMLVQDERPQEFVAAVQSFLAAHPV